MIEMGGSNAAKTINCPLFRRQFIVLAALVNGNLNSLDP